MMRIMISIQNRQRKHKITQGLRNIIEKAVVTTLEAEKVTIPAETSVLLVSNKGITGLNKEYRGKNQPTDVLSFPLYDKNEIREIREKSRENGMGEFMLGDIVVSLERACEQAEEYGHSFEREVGYLIVHGMLHLLGYDHMHEAEKKEMREKEEKILEILNLER